MTLAAVDDKRGSCGLPALGSRSLTSEDHVLLRPGVGALTMRTGDLVLLELRLIPRIFFHGLAGGRQFRCRRASH